MFKVVYVLIDDGSLFYYNELMLSLLSLKKHNPELPVCVLVDDKTETVLRNACSAEKSGEVYDYAEVKVCSVPEEMSNIERSRFLKVSLRELVAGSFLFMDIDTLVVDHFFDLSDIHIGMAKDFGFKNRLDDLFLEKLKLPDDWIYFNTGVMYVDDSDISNAYFNEVKEIWLSGYKENYHDEGIFNFVAFKQDCVSRLSPRINFQVSNDMVQLKYFRDCVVMHYMHGYENYPFVLYKTSMYRDSIVSSPYYFKNKIGKDIVENPFDFFKEVCFLYNVSGDDYNFARSYFGKLCRFIYRKCPLLFKFINSFCFCLFKLFGKV